MNNENLRSGKRNVHIGSIAVVTPPYKADQATADRFLTKHFSNKLGRKNLAVMHKILSHPGVLQRSFALKNPECLINEDPDKRIARFTHWAVELSAQAIIEALEQVKLTAKDVSGIVVNTCTGYICPGISTYLIEKLGLSPKIRAYDLVGSGCGGAVPNLQIAESILKERDEGVVLSVSVEICSATFQMEDDLSLIVSNAIFADGAAAAVLWNRSEGFELVASDSYFAPEHRDSIRYVYKKGQLHNQISVDLMQLVKKAVAMVVKDLLTSRSLKVEDIKHWALHNGGEKVIDAIKNELGLEENKLRATRNVLAQYGNMSSPTVWFVTREILNNGVERGDWCIMVTFGAGLSAHAFLLKKK